MTTETLTVKEAAEILEIHPQLVRLYIQEGLLPGAVKLRGTRWRIPRAVVELFDGADVSGVFSKKKSSAPHPFCWVEPPNGPPGQCSCVVGHIVIKRFADRNAAKTFATTLSDLAEIWAKNA